MTTLHLDWESRSALELPTVGLDVYSRHPSTDIWLGAYAFDDEDVEVWFAGQPCPPRVAAHIRAGGKVAAWNAQFEIVMCKRIAAVRHGWPVITVEQSDCVMARGYAMALPGKLEKAAPALGIIEKKDDVGHRLMLQMCRPRATNPDGTYVWWDEPQKIARLAEYAKQDVRTERGMDQRLMPLSAAEQALWVIDQKINARGVYVDLPTVKKAIAVVQSEQDRLNAAMRQATGNVVGFCTEVARLAKWVRSQGVNVPGLAKADVLDALEIEDLPENVGAALRLRQEAGKSSTAKFTAMTDAVSPDGRLRGMFQYHGAGTGRWAGRKVQLQNMVRPKLEHPEIERALDLMRSIAEPAEAAHAIELLVDKPMDVLSWASRALLCAAPGHELLAADFANIEGRGIAWLAGDERKLERFRAADDGSGPGIYEATAADILGKAVEDVTKAERQAQGKVPELACGYQGGVGAFIKMAKTYGVKIAEEVADRIVQGWRDQHPKIKAYWYALDRAAKDAVKNPGRVTQAGAHPAKFRVKGSFLWCLLPSGRALCYPYPRIDDGYTLALKDGRTKKISGRTFKADGLPEGAEVIREDSDVLWYMHVDGLTKKWGETDTYGGKLSENITQAICRDLLADSMKRVEAAGYPVVLHVHDELVAEVRAGDRDLAEFEALCAQTEPWAEGLPVVAAGWRGRRYRK